MDRARVLAKVAEFIEALDRELGLIYADENQQMAAVNAVKALLPVMERIAEEVDPERSYQWVPSGPIRGWQFQLAWDNALRLKTLLEQEDELNEMLGPSGPTLSAKGLHPWVWNAAVTLWDDGHRREAIQAAATLVDTQLQAKLGRNDAGGVKLIQDAFSPNPPAAGSPRLRFTEYSEGTDSWKNAHAGALSFGVGATMAIRNIRTHEMGQPSEQDALEELAALSVLARWIDRSTVVTV